MNIYFQHCHILSELQVLYFQHVIKSFFSLYFIDDNSEISVIMFSQTCCYVVSVSLFCVNVFLRSFQPSYHFALILFVCFSLVLLWSLEVN